MNNFVEKTCAFPVPLGSTSAKEFHLSTRDWMENATVFQVSSSISIFIYINITMSHVHNLNYPTILKSKQKQETLVTFFFCLFIYLSLLVDGGWSQWKDREEKCSKTCGGGLKIWRRTCSNPTPERGGKKCVGKDVEIRQCNNFTCKYKKII